MGRQVAILVRAEGITKSYGPTHVMDGAGFVIHPGDKIALVGPNGAGKTTLFRMLAGQLKADFGEFETKPDLRVAYLPQVPDIPADTPVAQLLSAPTARASAIEKDLAELEAWMAEPGAWEQSDSSEKMQRYSELQSKLGVEQSKGTATQSPLLNHLAIPEGTLEKKFGDLSGGERSKVLLCKALSAAKDTDLLLLDEPTNHMDIETVEFIEETIRNLDAAVVVSAHDEYLLDNVATRVFEVDNRRVDSYQGNYSSYQAQRRALQAAFAAKKKREFNEVKRQLAIIEELKSRNRFDAQVKSRKTRLQSQQQKDATAPEAPSSRKSFRLMFDNENPPRQSMEFSHVAKGFDNRLLFEGVSFEIEGGDKIGIVGPNGCGKSTFLKLLTGKLQPDSGEITVAPGVKVGYFDQHHSTLDPERSLIDEARTLRDPPPPDEWTRGLLGRFHFSGDDVFKKVKDLSGGERARLALAKFIVDKHNTLVLDEPTNHLDIESQHIVASALRDYEGTLIVVSHNRAFLDMVTTKTLLIAHKKMRVFGGNLTQAKATKSVETFLSTGIKSRYNVLKTFKDWEKDEKFYLGSVIETTGLESQGFRRLLRTAETEGWIELT